VRAREGGFVDNHPHTKVKKTEIRGGGLQVNFEKSMRKQKGEIG